VKHRQFRLIAGLAFMFAAFGLGCDGQRDCPSDFSCAELVKLTCGANDECASAQSCTAAKRLETDGDQGTCESAWCSLGEAYRECE
jgi:hypothetical protein